MAFGEIVFGLFVVLLLSNVTFVFATEFEFSQNDIEWCHDVYPQYDILGLDLFLENYHYSIEARVCGSLYEDSLWNYEGDDRMQKLLDRSKHYIELEIQESKEEAKTGIIDPTPAMIPPWIKDVAKFWIADMIDDEGFVQVIEWLVQNDIIEIPYAEPPEGEAAVTILSWIKTSAGFWVDHKISDDEFSIGLEWLINNGIIRV